METMSTLTPAPAVRRRPNPFRLIGTVLLFTLVLVRVLVRKSVALLVLTVLALGKNKPATAVGVVLGAALIWTWTAFGSPWSPPQAAAVSSETGTLLPPSPFVEQFIKGYQDYDATLVWDSFADERKSLLAQQGGGLERLRSQLAQAKRAGVAFVESTHVASVRLDDGRSVYLYIITQKGSQGRAQQVPYTFTTLPNGKILTAD